MSGKPNWPEEMEFVRDLQSMSPRVECRLAKVVNTDGRILQLRTAYSVVTFDVGWVPEDRLDWLAQVWSGHLHVVEITAKDRGAEEIKEIYEESKKRLLGTVEELDKLTAELKERL